MRLSRPLQTACKSFRLTTPANPFVRARGPTPSAASLPSTLADDFVIYPAFFTPEEQRMLLDMSLWKLDRVDSTRRRRRGRAARGGQVVEEGLEEGNGKEGRGDGESDLLKAVLQDKFVGPFGFELGHFDSVIHHYRESLVTTLPPTTPALRSLLARLYNLLPIPSLATEPAESDLPPPGSTMHVLHLAPEGEILPHVDNLEAMGDVIVGASLGAARVLRLEAGGGNVGMGGMMGGGMGAAGGKGGMGGVGGGMDGMGGMTGSPVRQTGETNAEKQGWDVLVPSGSVYVQKGSVRYTYTHAVLGYDDARSQWGGQKLESGHRISLMVRDMPQAKS